MGQLSQMIRLVWANLNSKSAKTAKLEYFTMSAYSAKNDLFQMHIKLVGEFRLFFITPVFEFRSSFDLEAAYTLMELQLVSLDQELVVSKHQFLVGFWNTIAIIEGNHHLLVLHRVEILNSFGVILCKRSIESGPSLEGDQSV